MNTQPTFSIPRCRTFRIKAIVFSHARVQEARRAIITEDGKPLTQEKFAERIGVSEEWVKKAESGEPVQRDYAAKAAKNLGKKLEELTAPPGESITLQTLVVVHGIAGVGKTTIARRLAHDPHLRGRFECCLYTSLGQSPNIVEEMKAWGRALGFNIDEEKAKKYARARLGAFLSEKRVLIIIDDAWTSEEAFDLMVGGRRCATFVTTPARFTAEFHVRRIETIGSPWNSPVAVAGVMKEDHIFAPWEPFLSDRQLPLQPAVHVEIDRRAPVFAVLGLLKIDYRDLWAGERVKTGDIVLSLGSFKDAGATMLSPAHPSDIDPVAHPDSELTVAIEGNLNAEDCRTVRASAIRPIFYFQPAHLIRGLISGDAFPSGAAIGYFEMEPASLFQTYELMNKPAASMVVGADRFGSQKDPTLHTGTIRPMPSPKLRPLRRYQSRLLDLIWTL